MGAEHTLTARTAGELKKFADRVRAIAVVFDEASQLLEASGLSSAKIRNVPLSGTAAKDLEKSAKKAVEDVEDAIKANAIASVSKAIAEKVLNSEAKTNNRSRKK